MSDNPDDVFAAVDQICRKIGGTYLRGEAWGGHEGVECRDVDRRIGVSYQGGDEYSISISDISGDIGYMINSKDVDTIWSLQGDGLLKDGGTGKLMEMQITPFPDSNDLWNEPHIPEPRIERNY